MPELPEVETIRRQLAPVLRRQQVQYVRVTRIRAVRAHRSPDDFIARVFDRTILDVRRRGKALLMPLDNDTSILIRLGMSGQLAVKSAEEPFALHTHVILGLPGDRELRFIDPRTFGQVAVVDGHHPERMVELGHYGVEPLSPEFTPQVLHSLCAGRKVLVQTVLMDQTQIAGIGKIYADEACFQAGIDPRRVAATLEADEISRLHKAIRSILICAIAARGTSGQDHAYRDACGCTGDYQQQLHVYQRENLPCRVCGTLVEFRPFQGRRMHFCPTCQK